MKIFHCTCGNVVYFDSTSCLKCGSQLGYDPPQDTMLALTGYKRCANATQALCNWLLPAASADTLCHSCRLNRTIPDLRTPRNRHLWRPMENAKRRLLRTLLSLGIQLPTRAADPVNGLAFDIVSTHVDPAVTTGHLRGIITVNLEEADDTYRQINRQQLGEKNRTLLGHFRHESGHYLWYRFLMNLEWAHPSRQAFREIFGNESQDYSASLRSHYSTGPLPGWEQQYISAYAASHPWEDWAETWAHYLQIIDGLETCESLGIHVNSITLPLIMLPGAAGTLPAFLGTTPQEDGTFLAMLQRWICLSTVLNEISQSLGEAPLYPFIISVPVARKLRLAHYLADQWRPAPIAVPVADVPKAL
jgi:hypothetical protein